MNPTHTNPAVPVQRRTDGSIDYSHYDARARVARSGAFRAACRSVYLRCRMLAAACLGRPRHRQAPAHAVTARRPQTFLENYAANAHMRRDRFSKAA